MKQYFICNIKIWCVFEGGNYFEQSVPVSHGDYMCICFHFPQALHFPRFSPPWVKGFLNVQSRSLFNLWWSHSAFKIGAYLYGSLFNCLFHI